MSCQVIALATGMPVLRVPHDRRLALVGDAEGGHLGDVDAGLPHGSGHHPGDVAPYLDRVVLDPSRLRVVVPVLELRHRDHPAGVVEEQAPARGGALVDGRDEGIGHVSAAPPSWSAIACGRRTDRTRSAMSRAAETTRSVISRCGIPLVEKIRSVGPEHRDRTDAEAAVLADRRRHAAAVAHVLAEVDAVADRLDPADLVEQRLPVGRRTAGVALERRLPQAGPQPRRVREQDLAQGGRVDRPDLAEAQPLRCPVGAEDVMDDLDAVGRRNADQDGLAGVGGQAVGPVHRLRAQQVGVEAAAREVLDLGVEAVAGGDPVLPDQTDVAQGGDDAVGRGLGQLEGLGDLLQAPGPAVRRRAAAARPPPARSTGCVPARHQCRIGVRQCRTRCVDHHVGRSYRHAQDRAMEAR